jgi:hypothetical protein
LAEAYAQRLRDDYKSLYDARQPAPPAPFGIDFDNVATLDRPLPPWKGSAIVNVEEVCGLKTLRDLRLQPECAEPFVKYFGVADASMLAKAPDRFSVHTPGDTLVGLKPHIDANATRPAAALVHDQIQGIMMLRQSPYNDQGFVVFPGHANDPGKWNVADTDGKMQAKDEPWCSVPDHMLATLGTGFIINPPAGSMILWRSTAVHGNTSGGGKRTRVGRVAAYVSMYPWERMSDEAKRTVETAWVTRVTHGHDLVTPRKQKAGGFFMATDKTKWHFGADRLTDYNSVAELPAGLRRPQ